MGLEIKSVIGAQSEKKGGVWVDYPDEDGVRFRLSYIGNDDYQDFVSQKMMKARRGRRDIPAEKQRAIIVEGLVKYVVKGWEGLTSGGQPFEFNPANAKMLLEQSSVIRDWVVSEANSLDNFSGEHDEEDSPSGDMKSRAPLEPRVG